MAAVDILMAELLEIAKSAESEGVRLAAVNSALDRAGLSAKQLVSVEATHKWDDTFEDGVVRLTDDSLSADEADEIKQLNAAAVDERRGRSDDDDDVPRLTIARDPSAPIQGVVMDRGDPDRGVVIPARVVEALRRSGVDI